MTTSGFEKYTVRKPEYLPGYPYIKGRQSPPMTFLNSRNIPEANIYIEWSWIHDIPQPNPYIGEYILDYDEILLHIGSNPDTPQDLGGTIELCLGGQPVTFNTTALVFIPAGISRGPVTWKEFHRPHIQLSIITGTGNPYAGGRKGFDKPAGTITGKIKTFDYEQYVIRSPMREAGPNHVDGRQNPTMTYLSRTQINMVNSYIEFGWIWDVPKPQIPKMRHDNFDEIVLHIGSDPDNPEDLGGTVEFGIGDDMIEFNTCHCVYAPRGLDHGPLLWKEVRRPLIELAMMLGAGTLAEGWENSFFDLPDGKRRGPK